MNLQNLPAEDADRGLICPLCRGPNHCALAAAPSPHEDAAAAAPRRCWCLHVAIDPALLERLAWLRGRSACICAACFAAGSPPDSAR